VGDRQGDKKRRRVSGLKRRGVEKDCMAFGTGVWLDSRRLRRFDDHDGNVGNGMIPLGSVGGFGKGDGRCSNHT
jgi:hypothetical protein